MPEAGRCRSGDVRRSVHGLPPGLHSPCSSGLPGPSCSELPTRLPGPYGPSDVKDGQIRPEGEVVRIRPEVYHQPPAKIWYL